MHFYLNVLKFNIAAMLPKWL